MIRALHVVKTSDGATWAARQAAILNKCGIEVQVAVPRAEGRTIPLWEKTGARIHVLNLDLPARKPWLLARMCAEARKLVAEVRPDLIHSHFVSTTLLLRLALGRNHRIPRLFQVPGPLHMEHRISRTVDLATAGTSDYWIGSSRCIVEHYRKTGVQAERVFLSYYGSLMHAGERQGYLRKRLGIEHGAKIVGNINLIYPPKGFLGHRVGLKCHEDVIDAIGMVQRERSDVVGVLIGSTFGTTDTRYEETLRARAREVGRGRILMPGYFSPNEVELSWPDFDCAVHVPVSENCGGAIEPLMAKVPTIAGQVGGLPEIVIDGMTGMTVPVRNPQALANAILKVLDNPEPYKEMAAHGRKLITELFNVDRTGREVAEIYRHILEGSELPKMACSKFMLDEMNERQPIVQ